MTNSRRTPCAPPVRRAGAPEGARRPFRAAVLGATLAAVVALICGWITTEVGRQPWIVYRVMRTEEAVTGASGIPLGYATVAAVYLALTVIAVALLRRLARTPLDHEVPGERAAHDAADAGHER